MKKLSILCILIAAAFTVTACGSGEKPDGPASGPSAAEVGAAKQTTKSSGVKVPPIKEDGK